MTTPAPTHYDSWSDVPPDTFLTRTQLAELDLPRRPGPLAATVGGYDFRDKKATIDLYRVDESTPSPASARQLAAARRRAPDAPDPRTCTDCGAHPELPVTVYQDSARLCRTCTHIRALRTTQTTAAAARAHAAELAAGLLADDRLAVLHIELTDRGTTPSGVRRTPSAARAVILDGTGRLLTDTTVRLIGPRSAGIPDDATDPETAAPALSEALAGRRILHWAHTGSGPLRQAVRGVFPTAHATLHDLHDLTIRWRGDIDFRTRQTRPAIPPGRADRMLYLLHQIAAHATPATGN